MFARNENNSFPIPISDPEGTAVTVTVSGLPAGLSVLVVNGEMRIQGTPSGPNRGPIPVTVTLTDSNNQSTIYTVDMWIADHGVSPVREQLLLSEFNYQEGPNDDGEYLEIFNAGPDPIDITGFAGTKHNLDDGFTEDDVSPYIFPATDENGQPSILGPGDRAVLWMWDVAVPVTQPEALRYVANTAFPNDLFNNAGDDIWLWDADGRIVDYLAFGTGQPGASVVNPPSAVHDFWSGSDAHLVGATNQQSMARASGGAAVSDPNCWELSTTGDATCAEFVGVTVDTVAGNPTGSPGEPNT